MSTFGKVVDGGRCAPGLHTERPGVDGPPLAGTQCVRYVPVSLQLVPAGQQVCWFGQQTAPSYGQHPCLLPEYAAAQTVPVWHTIACSNEGAASTTTAASAALKSCSSTIAHLWETDAMHRVQRSVNRRDFLIRKLPFD